MEIMTKWGRKKPTIVEYDSDIEVVEVSQVVRTEIVYEDSKEIIGVDIEFKWGQIYPMLVEIKVLEAGLEDLPLYENILRPGITKIATRLKIFPYAEVIGWMLPKIDTVGMMINDEEGKTVAYFAPAFISAGVQQSTVYRKRK